MLGEVKERYYCLSLCAGASHFREFVAVMFVELTHQAEEAGWLQGPPGFWGNFLYNKTTCVMGTKAGNMRKLSEYKPGLIWGSSPFT